LKRYERKRVRGWGSANDIKGKGLREQVWTELARHVDKLKKTKEWGREEPAALEAVDGCEGIGI
jgi:hypothetical protein